MHWPQGGWVWDGGESHATGGHGRAGLRAPGADGPGLPIDVGAAHATPPTCPALLPGMGGPVPPYGAPSPDVKLFACSCCEVGCAEMDGPAASVRRRASLSSCEHSTKALPWTHPGSSDRPLSTSTLTPLEYFEGSNTAASKSPSRRTMNVRLQMLENAYANKGLDGGGGSRDELAQ